MNWLKRSAKNRTASIVLAIILLSVAMPHGRSSAESGPCAAPSADFGTVTSDIQIPATASYRVWSRVALPATNTEAYRLEIDGTSCYGVSGAQLPVYASTDSTRFMNDSMNWTANVVGGQTLSANLSAGHHSFKLIGTSDGVVVDRLIVTQDTSCIPTGVGTNCSTAPDTAAPTVTITVPAANTVINANTTVSAVATDDIGISKVTFLLDGNQFAVVSVPGQTNTYTATLPATSVSAGGHVLTAIAEDTSGKTTTSSNVAVSKPSAVIPTPVITADINNDKIVNYLDLSILASNYGKSGNAIKAAGSDINNDGTVNYLDLSILANKYGK